MIEDKIDRLDTLHQLGTRCIQLTIMREIYQIFIRFWTFGCKEDE